jgi:hypothetical protein
VHRLAAMVSIVKAVETGQLTAAMNYGPLPAAAWLVFCAFNAIRRPLRRALRDTSPASGEVRAFGDPLRRALRDTSPAGGEVRAIAVQTTNSSICPALTRDGI